jgi:carboxyl-terminal processing protease
VPSAYQIDQGVGYTRLSVFSETSTQELTQAISQLRSQGMRSLILDLRTNPGGLLDQGVSISDLFLPQGSSIVETRARNPRDNVTFRARGAELFGGMPIVVLVDEYSASAAEIVAGALQDHDRALVIGASTFGKGSVQTLFPLSGGNFLKMTTGRWYTPVGRSIQRDVQRNGDPVALLEDQPIADDGMPLPEGAVPDTAGRRQYRTDSGRLVYGGGGIVPDLMVRRDTLTLIEREFFQAASKSGTLYNNVLFRYAIEYTRANPNLQPGFEVTPAMREEFFQRLQAAGMEVTREQFVGAERLIEQRLGTEISQAKFGSEAASQRANRNDPVIRAATELLRQAGDQQALFRLAETRAAQQAAR